MKKRLLLAPATLLLLTGLGSSWGIAGSMDSPADNLLAHEPHGSGSANPMTSGEGVHEHKTMQIPAGQPVPVVDLTVHPDAMKGWNLELKVSNFRFAPEKINTESNPTEGHAHLYVNGEKLTRVYGSWYYLSSLPPGQQKITVSLNANRHEDLVHNGKPIQDSEIISVPATKQ